MIGAAMLLLVAEPSPATLSPVPSASASTSLVAAPLRFAPPIGQPMAYRVTTRRLMRAGTLASYTLVYALRWERAGRGLQLAATLRRIESDARPELVQALTSLLRPLIGQTLTYLVASDGSSVDLIDPEAQWARVLGSVEAMGARAAQGEARQMAEMLAALPPAERDKMATADVRALIAPANSAIPAAADGTPDVKVDQHGERRTVAMVERSSIDTGGAEGKRQPIEIRRSWTIDTATGLVLGERRATRISGADGGEPLLVEESVRDLRIGDPG